MHTCTCCICSSRTCTPRERPVGWIKICGSLVCEECAYQLTRIVNQYQAAGVRPGEA